MRVFVLALQLHASNQLVPDFFIELDIVIEHFLKQLLQVDQSLVVLAVVDQPYLSFDAPYKLDFFFAHSSLTHQFVNLLTQS